MVARYHRGVAAPTIDFSGLYEFTKPPNELWLAIEQVDRFPEWWSWLQEFGVEGDGLNSGSALRGVVAPPVPYRMRIRVQILGSEKERSIDAAVHGDLEGTASFRLRPIDSGTIVDIRWNVEMMQRPMRLASRLAYPLLRWGHDRVVEMTLKGLPPEFGYKGSTTR
jgi:carbon monoxide dehydrogenase subunit G